MNINQIIDTVGLVTAVILPLFNIPLIIRMVKRKSSQDISLYWALGVWICILLMLPSALKSSDIVWRTFSISNVILFSCVVFVTLKYRKGCHDSK